MKQKSLLIAEERCKRLGLKNVTFYHGKIEEYDGKFDVGMSLHACGVATDLAFLKCLGRLPDEKEMQASLLFLKQSIEKKSPKVNLEGLVHSLFACLDFRYLN